MRPKLSYSNVVSTLCLFLLLGGGAAYAAGHLAKNSVGSKQLKKNAVTTAKIKKEAVTGAKVKKGTLTGSDLQAGSLTGGAIQDGSITGVDINQDSLNNVRAANVIGIALTKDKECSAALPLPSGVTSQRTNTGTCKLTFPNSLDNCTATGNVHFRPTKPELVVLADRTVQLATTPLQPNLMIVETYEGETLTNLPVDVTIVC